MVDCPLAAVLTTAAATLGEPALARLAVGLNAPVRVRVQGPHKTVRALELAGVTLCPPDEEPDILVDTVSDTAGPSKPDLAVLTEAELIGFTGAGPMTGAVARCAELSRSTGVPVVPLSATAALAALDPGVLDDDLFAVLQALAVGPTRPIPALRARLTAELGLFGIANAVTALRAGADRTAVRRTLRRVSGVDVVRAEIERVAAPARYRRIEAALTELSGLAAGPGGARFARLLAGDEMVLARMAAAAEVVRAAGMTAGPGGDLLSVAVWWRRYADGPVSELHRACGADLSRAALRLRDRSPARTVAPDRAARVRISQTRAESIADLRAACVALRAELQAAASELTSVEEFRCQARRRVAGLAAEFDPELDLEAALPDQPPLRAPALENRLTTLLGLTFGAGAALTLGRVLAELAPGWAPALAAGSATTGLGLGLWVVRARRLLSERAVAQRWASDVAAGLRSVLEERLTARFLAAEVTLVTSAPFGGCSTP